MNRWQSVSEPIAAIVLGGCHNHHVVGPVPEWLPKAPKISSDPEDVCIVGKPVCDVLILNVYDVLSN